MARADRLRPRYFFHTPQQVSYPRQTITENRQPIRDFLYSHFIYGSPHFSILAGDTGMSIAQEVGAILHKTVPPNAEPFANNELRVIVPQQEVATKDVYIIQSNGATPDTSLRHQKLIALGAKGAGANRIYAVFTNLPYSRQDRIDQPGAPDSARNVAQEILDAASHNPRKKRRQHISRLTADASLLVVDVHSTKPLDTINRDSHYEYANLDSSFVLTPFVQELIVQKGLDVAVAFPDTGAAKRYGNYASLFGQGVEPSVVKKVRPVEKTNEVHLAENQDDFRPKVSGKDVIVFDDMIDTGRTIVQAAEQFKIAGAKSVRVVATHGVFSGNGLQNLTSPFIDEVIITNTIPPTPEVLAHPKITIVSIAPLIAKVIQRIEDKRSIADLIKDISPGFERSYMQWGKINKYRRRAARDPRKKSEG